jgi:5'-phosphate synthase pdxT subunit
MKIGVLALQGAFREHCEMLRKLGVDCIEVRLPEHLEGLDGLIFPGGESTTIGKLADWYGLMEALKHAARNIPVWGTCGGLIMMSRNVGMNQPILNLIDMVVERNAFGRQVDSFEEQLQVKGLEGPFHGIFIRAPIVKEVGPEVEILCRLKDGKIVAVKQGSMLATSFHPELTNDPRFHSYFIQLIKNSQERN